MGEQLAGLVGRLPLEVENELVIVRRVVVRPAVAAIQVEVNEAPVLFGVGDRGFTWMCEVFDVGAFQVEGGGAFFLQSFFDA